ncbi:MAG: glycosyltransferase [Kiritimatiellae bacterium]|nr:glycosyltransferase [Kiritimatiellia bacterium]
MTLHQLVAGFRDGDAISNEAVRIRKLCEAHGAKSEIWAPRETTASDSQAEVSDVSALAGRVRPDDVALLHLSVGSRCNSVFPALPCRRAILYHNVTPAGFFERLDPSAAAILEEGRRQVAALRGAAHGTWADSEFNASELRAAGYENPKVLPLMMDVLGPQGGPADGGMLAKLSEPGRTNLLFVGRVVPNKRHDKLLLVFNAYRKRVDPAARLVVAGGASSPAYMALLMGMAKNLQIADSVIFTEFLTDAELRACYATASAFVCVSDHEGFCAPLLEAMAWRVPLFAVANAAVPETTAGAGVLFAPETGPETIAETMGRVLHDGALREAVLRRQDARLAGFRARDEWADLQPVLHV